MSEGKHPGGRPLKFQSLEVLQTLVDGYFEDCKRTEEPLTITGLCIALDTNRETLLDYQDKDEFSDAIKLAKLRIENFNEKKLYDKNVPTAGIIFNLTNNYKWQNKWNGDITSKGEKIGTASEEIAAINASLGR